MSEDAHETEALDKESDNDEIKAELDEWAQHEKKRREIEAKLWQHNERAINQDQIKWNRDAVHWDNLQRSDKRVKITQYIWTITNIIIAICAIIGAKNSRH